jgi:hypothetical protein
MTIPNIPALLALLAIAGGLGPVFSFLGENSKWFQGLTSQARFWIILVSSLLIPLLATALLQLVPPSVWVVLEPYWQALALGFVAFLTSQGFYQVKKIREAVRTESVQQNVATLSAKKERAEIAADVAVLEKDAAT